VESPLRLSWWFPSQVPSPERRQPYSGPSWFVNRATYPLVPAGIPTVSLVCTRSSVPESHRYRSGPTGETSDLPLVFPGNPLACHRRYAVSTAESRIPSIATRALWRHLATSTSHRSAVLCLSAQDGHRSHRNFVPCGSR
jgi:hypothetical protein